MNYGLTNLTAKDYTSNDDIVDNLYKKRMNVIEDSDLKTFTADGMVFCVVNFATSSDKVDNICNFSNTTPCVSRNKTKSLY